MKRQRKLVIAVATILLAVLGGAALYAQEKTSDKYALVSPGGIAFADFRGYEDWSVASSARVEGTLKVIVANQAMIAAYKAGIPGNGQPDRKSTRLNSSHLPTSRMPSSA